MLRSALYTGRVRHRRFTPVPHAFEYSVSLVYLDLAELPAADALSPLWTLRPGRSTSLLARCTARLERRDLLGPPGQPLDAAVRDRVQAALGRRPTGAVRLLTQLRRFGCGFNPVSFYYCFEPDAHDAEGERLDAIVADITSTPWRERHVCVVDAAAGGTGRAAAGARRRFAKPGHISPFLPMELDFDWRFRRPGARLGVHMRDLSRPDTPAATLARPAAIGSAPGTQQVVFDASLALRRLPLTRATIARHVLAAPLPPLAVLAAIYWQALRLRLAGAPFFAHPRHGSPAPGAALPRERT